MVSTSAGNVFLPGRRIRKQLRGLPGTVAGTIKGGGSEPKRSGGEPGRLAGVMRMHGRDRCGGLDEDIESFSLTPRPGNV